MIGGLVGHRPHEDRRARRQKLRRIRITFDRDEPHRPSVGLPKRGQLRIEFFGHRVEGRHGATHGHHDLKAAIRKRRKIPDRSQDIPDDRRRVVERRKENETRHRGLLVGQT
jgi:hypothetical protein